jgi:ABC-2 type transport system ATP-binding protein
MITIDKLSVRFGKVRAVDDLSLTIDKGENVLLAGANGAGKTTLLRALAGVLHAQAGSIRFGGERAGSRSRRRIAYISAAISLYDGLTIEAAVRLHARYFGHDGNREIKDLRLPPRQKISSLSKGEKTLFFLSLAMAAAPEYMFIDDVIHFLDPHLREVFLNSVLRLIEEERLTMVMASQSSFEIEGIPERVLVMDQGRIIMDEAVETLKGKFVKFYGRQIPPCVPVVYSRDWQDAKEIYIYPYLPEVHRLEGIEHLSLTEILRAMIGGEYDRH